MKKNYRNRVAELEHALAKAKKSTTNSTPTFTTDKEQNNFTVKDEPASPISHNQPPQVNTPTIVNKPKGPSTINSNSVSTMHKDAIILEHLQTPLSQFTIPNYHENSKQLWVSKVLNQMIGFPQFHPLLDSNLETLIAEVLAHVKTIDTILYTKLDKSLTDKQMNALTADSKTSSGVEIIKTVMTQTTMETETDLPKDISKKLQKCARGVRETITDCTDSVIKLAEQLQDTDYEVSNRVQNELWRDGLGPDFKIVLDHISLTKSSPPGWKLDLPIAVLKQTATNYLIKNPPITPKATSGSTPPKHTPYPPHSPEHKAYQKKVKQAICLYKFILDPNLEKSKEFGGKILDGCYFCNTKGHMWTHCRALNGMKQRAKAAYDQDQNMKSNSAGKTAKLETIVEDEQGSNTGSFTNNSVDPYSNCICPVADVELE